MATDEPTPTLTGFGDKVIAGPTTLNDRTFESIYVPAMVGCGFDTMTLNVHGVVEHALELICAAGIVIEMCVLSRKVTGDRRVPLNRMVLFAKKLLPKASNWKAAVPTTLLAGTMPPGFNTGV